MTPGVPVPDPAPALSSRLMRHPALRTWLLVGLATSVPYVKASLDAPAGRTFVGAFHWIDDVFQYLSFAQQAEDGRLAFENKLVAEPHPPALVNVEWWAVGTLSRLLGRRPLLAFHVVGLLAALGLLAGVDRWLVRAGLPATHRLPALILVSTAGGLGGWLFELTALPVWRCMDLATGVYPFLAILAQPHWATASGLLVWSLWTQTFGRGPRGALAAGLVGTALGLTRPYDLVLLMGIRVIVIHVFEPRRDWPGAWGRLATLMPCLAYVVWLFFFRPEFGSFASPVFSGFVFTLADQAGALGPPLAAAALAYRRGCWGPAVRCFQVWLPLVALVLWVRPLSLPNQFAVGWGLPLLVLLALALARLRPAATLGVAALLAASFLVSLRIAWRGDPHWHVPAERWAAAEALRDSCRGGGVFLGPPDIGLYTIALTGCRAWVSHQSGPDYEARLAQLRSFYGSATPAQRAALLDRACATHLALPAEVEPRSWLGDGSVRDSFVVAAGTSAVRLVVRNPPPRCTQR